MQKQISEIEKLNAKVIAIATKGDRVDVLKTESSLGITFTLIPTPNKKVAQDFGVEYDYSGAAFGTIIIDNSGSIRFKSLDDAFSRTSPSRIVEELQAIQ